MTTVTDMKKEQERARLHSTIWKIANDLRGSVDGWDFKQYVLGMLFYRFISENLSNYINAEERRAGVENFNYASLSDEAAEFGRADTVKVKGFYILPSELFENVRKRAKYKENLNEILASIFRNIENSARGADSEDDIKGLFDDLDVNSSKLGQTVAKRNERLVKLLDAIGSLEVGRYEDNTIDAFGDAYEFLMAMYASSAGKSGGEFFTPQEVSELLARITVVGKKEVNKVYDPACGSGSLLLKFAKVLGKENVRQGFFGQEINLTTYNLCRINMYLHDINYEKFDIAHGDTLTEPAHWDDEPFDAIVSNPPYSINWEGDANPILINDPRYSPAGVLAPKSKADLAFTMHILSWLSTSGTAAIVEFPGVLYRGGAEAKIRKYLIDNNFVDAVIQLPSDLFFGTPITTCILVLKKSKKDNSTLFIDASAEFLRAGNKNKLNRANQDKIINAFISRRDIDHFAKLIPNGEIVEKGYNLAVGSYIDGFNETVAVDIAELNSHIADIVNRQIELRNQIDTLVAEFEGVKVSEIEGLLQKYCPDGVQFQNLDEVASIKRGKRVTKNELSSDNEYPVYSGGVTPMGYYGKFNQEPNTITVVKYGTAGFVNFITEKFWANDVCYCIKPKEGLDNRYLFYVLKDKQNWIRSQATDAIPAHLPTEVIGGVQIPVPPIEIQKKIASVLDKFTQLEAELSAELSAGRKQYEYYRTKLLTFQVLPA